MTSIPESVKKEILADPVRKFCALSGMQGHVCGGRITWEHAITHAGKRIQAKWAIISICAKGHAVDEFQDAGTMNKELNQWVALNQASDDELNQYQNADFVQRRSYLNGKYGIYTPIDVSEETEIIYD